MYLYHFAKVGGRIRTYFCPYAQKSLRKDKQETDTNHQSPPCIGDQVRKAIPCGYACVP